MDTTVPDLQPGSTAESRYNQLKPLRSPYEERARQVAMVSVPMYAPLDDPSGGSDIPITETSFPARAVTHLGAKTLQALFPADRAFFRLDISPKAQRAIEAAALQDEELDPSAIINEASNAITTREQVTQSELDRSNLRVRMIEAIARLLVTGNCMVHLTDDFAFRVYPINRYVCVRDGNGKAIEMITEDCYAPATLEPRVRAHWEKIKSNWHRSRTQSVKVYTTAVLEVDPDHKDRKRWHVTQECAGEVIEGSDGFYTEDEFCWWPLRDIIHDSEHYGRSRCELYYGDFLTLQNMMRSFLDGAAIATKLIWAVSQEAPLGLETTLSNADNGAFIRFNPDHVKPVQPVVNTNALEVARQTTADIEMRLSIAFLLATSVQRQAERVTATEINVVAAEIEEVQVGLFTGLADSFQAPLVRAVIKRLEKNETLAQLPDDASDASILTGLSAIGRTADLNRLSTFLRLVLALPEAQKRLKFNVVLQRVAQAVGLSSPRDIIKTDAEYKKDISDEIAQNALNQGATSGAASLADTAVQQLAAPQQ